MSLNYINKILKVKIDYLILNIITMRFIRTNWGLMPSSHTTLLVSIGINNWAYLDFDTIVKGKIKVSSLICSEEQVVGFFLIR